MPRCAQDRRPGPPEATRARAGSGCPPPPAAGSHARLAGRRGPRRGPPAAPPARRRPRSSCPAYGSNAARTAVLRVGHRLLGPLDAATRARSSALRRPQATTSHARSRTPTAASSPPTSRARPGGAALSRAGSGGTGAEVLVRHGSRLRPRRRRPDEVAPTSAPVRAPRIRWPRASHRPLQHRRDRRRGRPRRPGRRPGRPLRRYRRPGAALREQYAALPAGAPVRLAKRTSNLFRPRAAATGRPASTSARSTACCTSTPQARTADVQGMTTYEHLVAATLPHGLVPLCVPAAADDHPRRRGHRPGHRERELPQRHAARVGAGDGRPHRRRPGPHGHAAADDPHRDLFHGFPNSYGTLGYALRLRIELEPVTPFVHLRHIRFDVRGGHGRRRSREVTADGHVRRPTGRLPATAPCSRGTEQYLTARRARTTDHRRRPSPSDYTGMGIYYRSIQQRPRGPADHRTTTCGAGTPTGSGARAPSARSAPPCAGCGPRARLRSDVYWKLVALDRRYVVLSDRVGRRRGRPPREPVVQDVEVPVDRLAEFLDFFHREVGIEPVWVCPLRQRDPTAALAAVRVRPRRDLRQRGLLVHGGACRPASTRRRAGSTAASSRW